jgi:hypothetical protein
MSGDDAEEIIENTLRELRNLDLQSDSLVVGKDFREVILRQMQLNHVLSDRLHSDIDQLHSSVKQFTASSKRVEKLTLALIGLTGVLAIMTYLLIPH